MLICIVIIPYAAKNYIAPDTFIIETYLVTIDGGALMGIGIGYVFRTGASTGGMDIPPLVINKLYIQLPKIVLVVDALIVLF